MVINEKIDDLIAIEIEHQECNRSKYAYMELNRQSHNDHNDSTYSSEEFFKKHTIIMTVN